MLSLLLTAIPFLAPAQEPEPMVVLKAAKVFTAAEQDMINNGAVVVQGKNIVAVGRAVEILADDRFEGAKVIDLGRNWLCPGAVEAHNHVAGSLRDLNDNVYLTNPGQQTHEVLEPENPYLLDSVAGGITSALFIPGSGSNMGGFGMLVKTAGETVEEMGFHNLVVSLKSTDTRTVIDANRKFAAQSDIPLHLGVTEAGRPGYGSTKSAAGLAPLLFDGIGDTIRVSLTSDPVLEIPVAFDILKATGARVTSPELISCPTCGRIEIDLEKLMNELEERLEGENAPVKIAVLGCVVNGPGEASEADIGIAGGGGKGILYRNGEQVRIVPEADMVDALYEEVQAWKAEQAGSEPVQA